MNKKSLRTVKDFVKDHLHIDFVMFLLQNHGSIIYYSRIVMQGICLIVPNEYLLKQLGLFRSD